MEQTPIELIAGILDQYLTCEETGTVEEILVPEQCALIYIGEVAYQVTITPA